MFLKTLLVLAQTNTPQIEMADALRADGKIYVVVAVVATIVLLILFYLIRLDQKIDRLKKEMESKKNHRSTDSE